jgi:hypothetical protein
MAFHRALGLPFAAVKHHESFRFPDARNCFEASHLILLERLDLIIFGPFGRAQMGILEGVCSTAVAPLFFSSMSSASTGVLVLPKRIYLMDVPQYRDLFGAASRLK